ncbi:MAG: UDP-N-acetylmuramoyl-tripeptide--D-alanyl-D-alanine ligase [Verrucomicrobiales bacterium]
MKTITAERLAQVTGGEILCGDRSVEASKVSTDTRTITAGSVFVALRGDRFDANRFAPQAACEGASILVVERWEGEFPPNAAVVKVADGLVALQGLARDQRMKREMPVVGITGSNGKTSTKDFARSVLSQQYEVAATKGNLNNHIGVPLTVLSIEEEHEAAVVEMGMNHAGEIAPLCEIARPNLGIITNIGTAHIEHLGSREGIAEEKGALARALPENGALLIPAGCDFYEYFQSRTKARVIPVGNGRGVVRAEELRQERGCSKFILVIEDESVAEVEIPVIGRHMVKNALLAAGCGWFLGMKPETIARGLAVTQMTSGRLRRYQSGGVTVFDDTYNANPESMAAAIDTLAEAPVAEGGQRLVVLGPMGELGDFAAEAHRQVGRLAAERGLSIVAVGEGAEGIVEGAGCGDFYPDPTVAVKELSGRLKSGDLALFKASRSAAMEKIMNEVFPQNN